MADWAVALPADQWHQLAPLRDRPGLAGGVDQTGAVWVLLRAGDAGGGQPQEAVLDRNEMPLSLRALPGEHFQLLADGQLVPLGRTVPRGRLPDCAWRPLGELITLTLPVPGWPAAAASPTPLRLVREPSPGEPLPPSNLLATDLRAWADYGATAPRVRLAAWRFTTGGGAALIWGVPLPPLPGRQYVEREGIAVEAGWCWEPRVSPDVLRQAFRLAAGEVAVLDRQGRFQRIAAEHWTAATRSAIRSSASREQTP